MANSNREQFVFGIIVASLIGTSILSQTGNMLSNTLNNIAVVWHLVNCIEQWPQHARLHGRQRPCDTPSPTLTRHNLTLIWQVVTF